MYNCNTFKGLCIISGKRMGWRANFCLLSTVPLMFSQIGVPVLYQEICPNNGSGTMFTKSYYLYTWYSLHIQKENATIDTQLCRIFRFESSLLTRTTGDAEERDWRGRRESRLESHSTWKSGKKITIYSVSYMAYHMVYNEVLNN